jgi:hypothetical protein
MQSAFHLSFSIYHFFPSSAHAQGITPARGRLRKRTFVQPLSHLSLSARNGLATGHREKPRMLGMWAFVLQLVVLANAILLTLPPGWCQSVSAPCQPEKVAARASCCHRAAPSRTSGSEETPVVPSTQCCCTREAVPPEKSVQHSNDLAVSLHVVAGDLAAISGPQTIGHPASAALSAGPPLRILLCVWRC